MDFFIYKIVVDYNKPDKFFNKLKNYVVTKINFKLCNNFGKQQIFTYKLSILRSSIKELQNKYFITYVYKAANNCGIICKHYYKFLLTDAIKNGDMFKETSYNIKTENRHIFNYYKLV